MTIELDILFLFVIPIIILFGCIIKSMRKPQFSVTYAIIAVVAGTFELTYVSAVSLYIVVSLGYLKSSFSLDFYGLTLFSPILIVISLVSISFGVWLLANKTNSS
jgi:hypothetical protein